jgi:hypothetical protein
MARRHDKTAEGTQQEDEVSGAPFSRHGI